MPADHHRPVVVDLFSGAGGLSLGFEQAGFDVRACVEIDPIHCAVHEFNFPQCATLCRSVSDPKFGAARIRKALGAGVTVDAVVGGPPCQGFSMIGKRALDDPRNSLVMHFLRTVVELEARYFVFENVRGLTVGRHRAFLDELLAEFDRHGYSVRAPWQVLNAANYGVPQRRERLFLLGARRGERVPFYPAPVCRPADEPDILDLPPGPTVREALGDLPDAERFKELLRSDSVRAKFKKPSPYAAKLRGLLADDGDFSHPRVFDRDIMTSSLRTDHTPESRERFAEAEPGRVETVSRFFKLDPDGLSNTLRAGTASDRGAYTSPRPIHPEHPRCVTVREAARLHSYPDWFRFHVTKWHGARQIGNSVPPLLGRAVASEVIRAMGIEPVKPATQIALGSETLLELNMVQAASRYGVASNVIAQRIRKPAAEIARGEEEREHGFQF